MSSLAQNYQTEKKPQFNRESSPFELLIQSQAMNRLESVHVHPSKNKQIEIRVSLQIHGDYRLHWLIDTLPTPNEAYILIDTLIDAHSQQHKEDLDEMAAWREALNDTSLYSTKGVSVFLGSV